MCATGCMWHLCVSVVCLSVEVHICVGVLMGMHVGLCGHLHVGIYQYKWVYESACVGIYIRACGYMSVHMWVHTFEHL